MRPLPLSRIAQWTGGRLLGDGQATDVLIDAVETDTRTLDARDGRGALFVALKGSHFDGHDHVAAAAAQGARAALVARQVEAPLPQVLVADTERALGALAAALQHARRGRVVGITGSNGKTSVKQLTLEIASRAMRAHANPGNRNNEIGLPLSVIETPDDVDVAIYEMGAGKRDDIAYLTSIARPHVALVNNVAPAHLERMQSLMGIAETKGAIYEALPYDGTAVINADDAFSPYFANRAQGRRVLRFGLEASADVTARDIACGDEESRFTLVVPGASIGVRLPLPGRHNIANALAASSIALALGVPLDTIAAALSEAEPVKGRLVRHRLANGAMLIDDSYNANPGSLNAAIDTLAAAAGESWLVLGDMRELGGDAEALHAEAGRRARRAGIARVYAIGPLSRAAAEAFGEGGRHFQNHGALVDALRVDLHAGVRVLVKGSRGSAMDRVVDALLPETGGHDAA
ncbi:UDP-N-acetylmuramoyl-tripeptide--D-alanyl-D-alanine ligase [Luteimonas wenzhouensis]|jgi:UDP-N-acetylmuramoyl-tripeptide--D-alanyl-D-alanine ligase|uniref:UDP-N-acetylmuramoyl-tripeptide--D-alanyl-D-alanine ligase n=1 Tax=Luteimonas wenzhouensis TaxID=2599615 RepID=A0A5C5U878_9GAMM|nr:UDP-N-acetylmuramoyl-tripeptide--D-alanyl-D-alanine ligase [Luteimonas wenzhouensis]NLW95459.1 UDP-N-acetylmuramoyl-tripeptide--D-alanyl-D-alanine ligase [Xanthomonadaceae bacterium]TWT22067.1 UDP-N-acetylmuramoyl-tripeptide--D-alanyl-D-alanine ligase [Luteimonas wenzhouensis]